MTDEPTFRNRPYISRSDAVGVQQIGPYRLIRSIGEGGMGSVFLAEQDAPVRRKVAIKVIRSPFSRAEDRIRFQAEQQAMARLQHPNVAQMFEAGTTVEGYPFFVMEWLDGESLTEFCDRKQLSVDERLALFVGVCDGVQHAHQKSDRASRSQAVQHPRRRDRRPAGAEDHRLRRRQGARCAARRSDGADRRRHRRHARVSQPRGA